MQTAIDEAVLIQKYIALVRELGHFPTVAEMRMKARNDGAFPNDKTIRRLGSTQELAAKILTYCHGRAGYDDVVTSSAPVAEAPHASREKGRDRGSLGKSRAREDTSARVIRPEEPFSNVVRLRSILRESEEFIDWADPHFSSRALEELIVTLDPARVRAVRILSGLQNVTDRAKRDFERFCDEVRQKGIVAEWRTLLAFAHDRFIITKDACYNVPPINSLLKGSYSEILETPNRPPFDEWWEKASPI
jgi:hypothetical protein